MLKSKLKVQNLIVSLFILFLVSVLLVFLIVNIAFSQLISPLYYRVIKEDKTSVISLLEKMKDFSSFPYFFGLNKQIYGNQIEQAVFAKEIKRKETIQNLELLLQRNPKSRDIVYQLSLLYNNDGNTTKANEYLKRAKEIDREIDARY